MQASATNRDLYTRIAAIGAAHEDTTRSLEQYLATLFVLASAERHQASITVERFLALLDEAFRAPAPSFEEDWRRRYARDPESLSGYALWERIILRQIVDLREMDEAGTLANEMRYFGVDAPRGLRWYNFDPRAFLECGAAGTFDGWREGDDTGRELVPGKVAVMDEHGAMHAVDPASIEPQTFEVAEIDWDLFTAFLESGQWYE